MRVTFQPDDDQKLVFSIRGRVVDVVNDAEEAEE
jgi:dTDP-4-dehydrorhamnose 3,5-epimerase-like enzyme